MKTTHSTEFVVINDETFLVNTEAEIDVAAKALRGAHLPNAPVITSHPLWPCIISRGCAKAGK
jgi:hypothetical protein